MLTIHVERDGTGNGSDHIVVGCLACQDRIQMLPFQLFQSQNIPNFFRPNHFIAVVQKGVLLPPRHARLGPSCTGVTLVLIQLDLKCFICKPVNVTSHGREYVRKPRRTFELVFGFVFSFYGLPNNLRRPCIKRWRSSEKSFKLPASCFQCELWFKRGICLLNTIHQQHYVNTASSNNMLGRHLKQR